MFLSSRRYNLQINNKVYPCAVGKNGIVDVVHKEEGDMRTPTGSFKLIKIYYRPHKVSPTEFKDTSILLEPLTTPWLIEDIYDIIGVLDYISSPTISKGSAIFLHVTKNYTGTDGCIALKKEHLLQVFSEFSKEDILNIKITGEIQVIKIVNDKKLNFCN